MLFISSSVYSQPTMLPSNVKKITISGVTIECKKITITGVTIECKKFTITGVTIECKKFTCA